MKTKQENEEIKIMISKLESFARLYEPVKFEWDEENELCFIRRWHPDPDRIREYAVNLQMNSVEACFIDLIRAVNGIYVDKTWEQRGRSSSLCYA